MIQGDNNVLNEGGLIELASLKHVQLLELKIDHYKFILVSSSPVFRKIFRGQMTIHMDRLESLSLSKIQN